MRKFVVIWALVTQACAFVLIGSLLPAEAEAQQQKISSKQVGEPLKAAQEAIQKKHWDEAMAQLKKANAVATKTPFEQYSINELTAYVMLRTGDSVGAAKLYEQNLASGQVPADQVTGKVKTLAQLYFQSHNYPKAIEYGNRWIKANGGDIDAQVLVAQSYYQLKDCKNAARAMQGAIDTARRANQPIKQNWLDLKLYCQNELNDTEGVIETREQLVRSYPTKEHWDALLTTLYNQGDNDDLTTLNYYRLMLDLDVLKKPSDFVEMAQMDLETKVPGEAVTVMDKGFASKVLDNKDKDRHMRLLANARTQAQGMQKQMPELDKTARASRTGEEDVGVGMAYYGFGQYDKAVEAIQRGLQKGANKRTDEAQITLGRAYLKLNQKDAARKAFKAVPDDSKLGRVAQLYGIYASQS